MIVMMMPASLRRFAGTVGIFVLTSLGAYAQSEVDPDHFDSPNTEPIPQPKLTPTPPSSETRYDGKFTLPYEVAAQREESASWKIFLFLPFGRKARPGRTEMEGPDA